MKTNGNRTNTRHATIAVSFALSLISPAALAQDCARLQARLSKPSGMGVTDFGSDVGVNGDWAIVGAALDDVFGRERAGSVHLYARSGSQWSYVISLASPELAAHDRFGTSVAIDGTRAVVGAPGDDPHEESSGSATVLYFDGAVWSAEAILDAPDGTEFDEFGSDVAILGNSAFIGAPQANGVGFASGIVYWFANDGISWNLVSEITASDGDQSDNFGSSVAVRGDLMVVGAFTGDGNVVLSGTAYVFRFDGSTWVEEAKLIAPDGAAGDWFGLAVDVSPNLAVIGAPQAGADTSGGKAYVFRFDGSDWSHDATLQLSPPERHADFGASVVIVGSDIFFGAPDAGGDAFPHGLVTRFRYNGSSWLPDPSFNPPENAKDSRFGARSARDGTTVLFTGGELAYSYNTAATCPIQLNVDARCSPGNPFPIQISWSGATPSGQVALLFSPDVGYTSIPTGRPCVGTELGLNGAGIQIALIRGSDANGSGTVVGTAPPQACDGFLQLLDLSSCDVSDVVRID